MSVTGAALGGSESSVSSGQEQLDLTPETKAAAIVALETLHATEEQLKPDFWQLLANRASSAFALSPKDHVLLQRTIGTISQYLLAHDHRGAREAAAKILTNIADAAGLSPSELGDHIARRLSAEITKAPIHTSTAGLGKGLVLNAKARVSWDALMGRVGQWEAKEFLSDLLQRAQLGAMLGKDSSNASKHFLLGGESGSGRRSFAQHFAPILHALRYTKSDKFYPVAGSEFHGGNSGKINERVNEIFKAGKDGVIFIDEIQSLTSQGQGSWSSSVYGAISAKLSDPDFKNTVVIFGGSPQAGEDLKNCDPGLRSSLPDSNRIFLSNLNVGELQERFLQIVQKQGWEMPTPSIEAARKLLATVGRTPSFGNSGFVENLVEHCLRRMADRLARQPDEPKLLPEDIALPPGTYYPCALFEGRVTHGTVRTQLAKNVIGQPSAVDTVAQALVTRHYLPTNTEASRKPVFRLHFMGPSASGKSLLAKETAKTFMRPGDVAAGRTPPVFELAANTVASFKRYLAGPERSSGNNHPEAPLLEWMKSSQGGVIVINEVDKGPSDTMATLMEIFDTGRYTPNSGREFDFSNFGFILTSNFGNEIGLHNVADIEQSNATPAREAQPGEVNGLASHVAKDVEIGGSTMRIIAVAKPGRGKVELKTGAQRVMSESAEIGLTYLRTHAKSLGIEAKAFDDTDFVIDVSSAAMQKDDRSAGIAMAVAMVSYVAGKPIPNNIAMSGELSLAGTVEPVSGIREKVLGAFEQGIDTIVLSEKNRRDVEALPKALRDSMSFEYVQDLRGVLRTVFEERSPNLRPHALPPELYQEIAELRAEAYMERIWPSEVLGRFDTQKPVLFRSLSAKDIREIIRLNVRRQAEENLRDAELELRVSGALEEKLLKKWDKRTGARPVLRALTSDVIVPLLQAHAATPRSYPPGTSVVADLAGGRMTFTPQQRSNPNQQEVKVWVQASRAYESGASELLSHHLESAGKKQISGPALVQGFKPGNPELLIEALDEERSDEDRVRSAWMYLLSGDQISFEDARVLLSGLPRESYSGWKEPSKEKVTVSKHILKELGLGAWTIGDFEYTDLSVVLWALDKIPKPLSTEQKKELSEVSRKILSESRGLQNKIPKYVGGCFLAVDRILNAVGPILPESPSKKEFII